MVVVLLEMKCRALTAPHHKTCKGGHCWARAHCGCCTQQALVELQQYLRSAEYRAAPAAEARAAERLQAMLQAAVTLPLPQPLSVQSSLQVPSPEVSDARRLPLTW